jgi:hypothetical protein
MPEEGGDQEPQADHNEEQEAGNTGRVPDVRYSVEQVDTQSLKT